MKKTKYENCIMGIYKDAFKKAAPSADFEELMRISPKNEKGEIVIPYNDYIIDEEVFEEIVDKRLKKHKITEKRYKQNIKMIVYLGCSPKFKLNSYERSKNDRVFTLRA
jgi:hypothetical protein